jgi:hypothetical protein
MAAAASGAAGPRREAAGAVGALPRPSNPRAAAGAASQPGTSPGITARAPPSDADSMTEVVTYTYSTPVHNSDLWLGEAVWLWKVTLYRISGHSVADA